MGMCLSISRIGSVTNNIVSPYLANHFQSLNIPFFFSCCLILVGLLSSFIVIYIGRYADRLINNGGGGDDHSKSNKDVYVSNNLSRLRYSVPEFISKNNELSKKIKSVSPAKKNEGGDGALVIKLKKL